MGGAALVLVISLGLGTWYLELYFAIPINGQHFLRAAASDRWTQTWQQI
jgi:hypothetical protein